MKKIFVLTLVSLFAATLFNSCGKDNDESPYIEKGKKLVKSFTVHDDNTITTKTLYSWSGDLLVHSAYINGETLLSTCDYEYDSDGWLTKITYNREGEIITYEIIYGDDHSMVEAMMYYNSKYVGDIDVQCDKNGNITYAHGTNLYMDQATLNITWDGSGNATKVEYSTPESTTCSYTFTFDDKHNWCPKATAMLWTLLWMDYDAVNLSSNNYITFTNGDGEPSYRTLQYSDGYPVAEFGNGWTDYYEYSDGTSVKK